MSNAGLQSYLGICSGTQAGDEQSWISRLSSFLCSGIEAQTRRLATSSPGLQIYPSNLDQVPRLATSRLGLQSHLATWAHLGNSEAKRALLCWKLGFGISAESAVFFVKRITCSKIQKVWIGNRKFGNSNAVSGVRVRNGNWKLENWELRFRERGPGVGWDSGNGNRELGMGDWGIVKQALGIGNCASGNGNQEFGIGNCIWVLVTGVQ